MLLAAVLGALAAELVPAYELICRFRLGVVAVAIPDLNFRCRWPSM
jgi:hypothetical protein